MDVRKASEATVIMLDDLSFIQEIYEDGSINHSTFLTYYFIRALKAVDLPNSYMPLKKVREWCLAEANEHAIIDPFLLHSLILLGEEDHNYVREKIKELRTQRRKADGRFELPTGYIPQGDVFSTMFAINIILDLSNYRNYFKDEEIEKSLNWIINHRQDLAETKDKAFIIYLLGRYNQRKYHDKIIELYKEIHTDIRNLLESIKTSIASNEPQKIIEGNKLETMLWIIYDLIDIKYNEIHNLIKDAMDILHNILDFILQFYQPEYKIKLDDALIYFKVRIASLIVSIFSKYYKKNFTNTVLELLLNQRYQIFNRILSDLRFSKEKRFIESLEHLVKKWIRVEVTDLTELTGGLSGTRVYRVKSKIVVPVPGYKQELPLPSLIIKRSNMETLRKEEQNYDIIPDYLKEIFAKPSTTLSLPSPEEYSTEFFLILEDLIDYHTLDEILEYFDKNYEILIHGRGKEALEKILNYVFMKLRFMYEHTIQQEKHILVLPQYFKDIFKSLSLLSEKSVDSKVLEIIVKYLIEKYKNIKNIEPSFTTFIHGDLNCRNIMIRIEERNKYVLKLIDIDSVNIFGDYAFDIGELYVDIIYRFKNIGKYIANLLEDYFTRFAEEKGDRTFKERLELAKIRSFIKLAKIHIKRNEIEKAKELLNEVIKTISNIQQ